MRLVEPLLAGFEVDVAVGVEGAGLGTQHRPFPAAAIPNNPVGATVGERLHPHLRAGDPRRVLKDPGHPLVRRERLALGDAERCEVAVLVAIGVVCGLRVDQVVEHLPVAQLGLKRPEPTSSRSSNADLVAAGATKREPTEVGS